MQKYAQKNIFGKIFLTKYLFRKKIHNKFLNILGLVLFYVLNTFEPLGIPQTPRKNKKVIFRDLKIRAGVQKVALKHFLLVLGPKNFRRSLPYLHAGKVSDLGNP